MEALAVLLQEGFCKIWPCGAPIQVIGPAILGAIIAYLVIVYLLKYRRSNKL